MCKYQSSLVPLKKLFSKLVKKFFYLFFYFRALTPDLEPINPPSFIKDIPVAVKYWIGKDYTNFIVKDFCDLDSPYQGIVEKKFKFNPTNNSSINIIFFYRFSR